MKNHIICNFANNDEIIFFFSLMNLTNVNTQIQKCQNLLKSIDEMEKEIAEKWLFEIPIKIENNLQKKLFIIRSNHFLGMNFTEEVSWVRGYIVGSKAQKN